MKNIILLFISLTLISSISHSSNQCRNLFLQGNPSETEVNILFRNAISDPNLENGISNIQNRFLGALKKIINDNRRRSHEYGDGFSIFSGMQYRIALFQIDSMKSLKLKLLETLKKFIESEMIIKSLIQIK